MRLLFASRNFALVDDLATRWAGVDVVGVAGSYDELVENLGRDRDEVDVVIADAILDAQADRTVGRTIDATVREVRVLRPNLRLIVIAPAATVVPAIDETGAALVVVNAGERSAANLAAALGLTAKAETARVIAVAGLEGGAGRTTIARAIAAAAADRVGKQAEGRGGVLLWEFDVRRPTTIAFDLEAPSSLVLDGGRRTVARLLGDAPFTPDRPVEALRSAVVPAESARLPYDILLAPYGIREILAALGSQVALGGLGARLRAILAAAATYYRVIVLDCPNDPTIDPGLMTGLTASDAIALVATPSAGGLSSVVAMSEILEDLRAVGRTRLVLNKVGRETRSYTAAINESARGIATGASLELGAAPNVVALTGALLEV